MNDRFKFRAWDTEEKKMILPSAEDVTDNEVICFNGTLLFVSENPVEDTAKVRFFEHNRLILMQCTGLKDKNGKLIYEGDIVKNDGYSGNGSIGIVEFGAHDADSSGGEYGGVECYGWYIRTIDNKQNDYPWKNGEFPNENIEIIGNIYENPELLNPT